MYIFRTYPTKSFRMKVAVGVMPLFQVKDVAHILGVDDVEALVMCDKMRATFDYHDETYLIDADRLSTIVDMAASPSTETFLFKKWARETEVAVREEYLKHLEQEMRGLYVFIPVKHTPETEVFVYAMRVNLMEDGGDCKIIIDVSDDVRLWEWAFYRWNDSNGRFLRSLLLEGIPVRMAKHMIDRMLHRSGAWVSANMFQMSEDAAIRAVDSIQDMLNVLYHPKTIAADTIVAGSPDDQSVMTAVMSACGSATNLVDSVVLE